MWMNNFKLITKQAVYIFKVWINKICWGKIFYQNGSSNQMSWVHGSTLLCESPGPASPSLSVLGFRTLLFWMLVVCKYISPGYSLQGQMLKLKLQYFGHLMLRVDSMEKTLMLGGIGGRRRRGWQGSLACYDSWGRKESDSTERLKWTELIPWGGPR